MGGKISKTIKIAAIGPNDFRLGISLIKAKTPSRLALSKPENLQT
jgi:hypothetical protein